MEKPKRRIKVGTCGYSYPGFPPKGWYGVFYPKLAAKKFGELEYYSRFFDVVEINTTFYRPPAPAMVAGWVRKTPAEFEFAIKGWQKFTHPRKLGEQARKDESLWGPPTQADVELFTQGIAPLAEAGKLGILLFQFPPSFRYTEENLDRLGWILRVFEDYPQAIELRHRSWSDRGKETYALLDQFRAAWAVIDEPQFPSSVGEVGEPMEAGAEIFYLRLHGRNREKWWNHQEAWERYDYLYSPEEIGSFAQKIQHRAQRSPTTKMYVFFNNHARGQAVANGLMLKTAIGGSLAGKVPRALVDTYPQLASLVPVSDQETLF